jgi:hypothetical protein
MDIILANEDESILINVELNREYKSYTELRNRRYLHRIASNTLDNKHSDKRKVIQLNLNAYLSREKVDLSRETFLLHDIENDITIDDFIIHNIFIQKEIEVCYNESIKNKLKLFLCDTYEKMKEVESLDKELKIIVDELERLNNEKYFGALYDREEEQIIINATEKEEGRREGLQQGMQQGLQQGMQNERTKIALNLLKENIDINVISKVTNLTIEEINKLKEEI